MPTVFIPSAGSHDFSDATRYGSLFFLSSEPLAKFSVNHMSRLWIEALKDSTKEDFILPCGLSIFTSIGCAIFASKHGVLNLLLFRDRKYLSRRILLKEERK